MCKELLNYFGLIHIGELHQLTVLGFQVKAANNVE